MSWRGEAEMTRGPAAVKEVSVTIYGVTRHGSYYIQNKMVHVQSACGSKATQLGGLAAETVAKMLLPELVRATFARGEKA